MASAAQSQRRRATFFVPQAQLASERGANADVLTAAEELQDAIRDVQDAQALQQKWSTAVNEVWDPPRSLPSHSATFHPQGLEVHLASVCMPIMVLLS